MHFVWELTRNHINWVILSQLTRDVDRNPTHSGNKENEYLADVAIFRSKLYKKRLDTSLFVFISQFYENGMVSVQMDPYM